MTVATRGAAHGSHHTMGLITLSHYGSHHTIILWVSSHYGLHHTMFFNGGLHLGPPLTHNLDNHPSTPGQTRTSCLPSRPSTSARCSCRSCASSCCSCAMVSCRRPASA